MGGRLVRVREREQRGKGGGVGGGLKVKVFHCLTREGVKKGNCLGLTGQTDWADQSPPGS